MFALGILATALASPLPAPLAGADGAFVTTGARTGRSAGGLWAAALAGVGVEHGPMRIVAAIPYGVVVGADRASHGLGQPELVASLVVDARAVRPEAGVTVGLPLPGTDLALPVWRFTPWLGVTAIAGGLEASAQVGGSIAPAARPIPLADGRDVSSLAHAPEALPVAPGAPPPHPPPPSLDTHAPGDLLATLTVGPRSDDGGRVAGTLALTQGAHTDLAIGVLAATPPRRVRFVGALATPVVDGGAGDLRIDAKLELRPAARAER